jgi:hypothetical protein
VTEEFSRCHPAAGFILQRAGFLGTDCAGCGTRVRAAIHERQQVSRLRDLDIAMTAKRLTVSFSLLPHRSPLRERTPGLSKTTLLSAENLFLTAAAFC